MFRLHVSIVYVIPIYSVICNMQFTSLSNLCTLSIPTFSLQVNDRVEEVGNTFAF